MRHSLYWLLAVLPCCLASSVKNIVVFGDSYSDTGNVKQMTNGPLWHQNLAVGWNASLYSFAFSGATCNNDLNNQTDSFSISDQLEMYYKANLDLDPSDTVYALWAGMGDIEQLFEKQGTDTPIPDMTPIVDCLSMQMSKVRRLFRSNRFIMFTIPPLELMPHFSGSTSRKQAAEDFNQLLQKRVIRLNKNYHALELDLVDVDRLLSDIAKSPSDFHFKDATHAYWDVCQGQCADDMDSFVWWDKVHLTGGVHRAIASSILLSDSMEPPVRLDDNAAALVKDTLRFQSPTFKGRHHTGLVDEATRHLEEAEKKEKDAGTDPEEENDTNSASDSTSLPSSSSATSGRGVYLWVLVAALLCAALAFLARRRRGSSNLSALSNLVRTNRPRYAPLQNV